MLVNHIFRCILPILLISSVLAKLNDEAETSNNIENNIVNNKKLNKDNEYLKDISSKEILTETREFVFSYFWRQSLRKILNQMPCGWSQFGIPSLAPFQMENLNFSLVDNITETQISVDEFRLDGLNDVDIDKLIVGYAFNKIVYFDLNFRNITASGKFKTDIFVDLAQLIGTNISVNASGDFNLSLQDVRFKGSYKYKLPILLGSAKIFDFKVIMTLGNVHSEIKGTMNLMPITDLMNRSIENFLLKKINNNQIFVSAMLEQLMMPMINEELEGKKLWNVLEWSLRLYKMDECKTEGSNEDGKEIPSNDVY